MNFGQAISSCFAKYATFKGRAPRSEYWYWTLFIVLGAFVAGLLDVMAGTSLMLGVGLFYVGFVLLGFLPGLGVGVRRLHDLDRSGWWWWIVLVPVVGWILILVWFCTRGTGGPNRFGSDPLMAR